MNFDTTGLILTPDNMHNVVTETTTEVWCTRAIDRANTNFDGDTHFCQYCGATDHEPVISDAEAMLWDALGMNPAAALPNQTAAVKRAGANVDGDTLRELANVILYSRNS